MEPEGGSTLDEDGLEAVYIVCISKLAKGKKKIFPLLTATSLVEDMGHSLIHNYQRRNRGSRKATSFTGVLLYLRQALHSYSAQKWL